MRNFTVSLGIITVNPNDPFYQAAGAVGFMKRLMEAKPVDHDICQPANMTFDT